MVPDPQTLPEAATWHYVVAVGLFALIGAVGHVVRAVFNILPDRLSDRPMMDLVISDGYSWQDMIFKTEYDDAGYYRLDSLHNLRLAVGWAMFSGFLILLLAPDASRLAAYWIDFGLAALVDLFWYRVETFEW
ncbi:hypothetical protein H6M51_15675 [Rhizobium sp. AQ_MP]|uniref:hypothetical protein n=1 Tax=Rhizobium sp. AQ_MP TaxID=2761536 RepID=UPI00163A1288|nr:hypothetical protein [Rhizobium sp. AQ_MP]MBC2774304.1 hypothetical protein [Rhizobium sp. AQ_MP]